MESGFTFQATAATGVRQTFWRWVTSRLLSYLSVVRFFCPTLTLGRIFAGHPSVPSCAQGHLWSSFWEHGTAGERVDLTLGMMNTLAFWILGSPGSQGELSSLCQAELQGFDAWAGQRCAASCPCPLSIYDIYVYSCREMMSTRQQLQPFEPIEA